MRGSARPGVPALFRTAELRAERAIALLRLGMSSTLAVLLVVLLGGAGIEPSETMQRQTVFAMVTMASYFLLGLGFLLVIRAGAYRSWMAWPSALVDCGFILSGLWVSMQNLDLTGHYVWAFPTIWLAPVVLASGALRFNPLLQVAMVLTLVVGLLLLLPLAGPSRSIEGLSALEILFGTPPNLMRLAMLTIAGLVLVFASVLIRRLLLRFIDEAEARGRLTRFLPQEVQDQLVTTDIDTLREGTSQTMAVMFVDIRGFTAMAERMSPSDVSAFLTAFRARISAAVERYGGIVDKFIGDGALIVFDDRDETAADRSMEAALAMLNGVAQWRSDIRVGIGLHLGPVFAGVVGDEGRLEFTVIGDIVNVAARLEAATKQANLSVLVSDTLWRASKQTANGWVRLPALSLPGRVDPVVAWGRA